MKFGKQEPYSVPCWDEYFLSIAEVVSVRSPDSQTKHGCVITDKNNHIIGTGYNGFCQHVDKSKLPNVRPEKYDFMIHSEINAISNCIVSPWMFADGATAYVTGKPCITCLQSLINNNVNRIVTYDSVGWAKDEEQKEKFDFIVKSSGIEYQIRSRSRE